MSYYYDINDLYEEDCNYYVIVPPRTGKRPVGMRKEIWYNVYVQSCCSEHCIAKFNNKARAFEFCTDKDWIHTENDNDYNLVIKREVNYSDGR